MAPAEAGAVLARALKDPRKPLTVADAEVASGLARRDVEAGLTWLTSEYRGHLRVTEEGELLRVFPHGFTKPWETKDALSRAASAVGHALVGAGRFVLRAWIFIVLIGYVALFLALVIGLTFARASGSSDRDDGPSVGTAVVGSLFRVLADALFWTFHPFSPFYVDPSVFHASRAQARGHRGRRAAGEPEVPFYEKVNRFVFGPTERPEDPNAARARVLQEIRAKKGRIGLADVMRVTGLPRDQADPLMARLMLDHEGDVEVGEQGGIFYRFESLRRTAEATPEAASPAAAWERPKRLAPLTGNGPGADVLVGLLNLFNLSMGAWVIAHGFTLHNLVLLFTTKERPVILPDDGVPFALGVVPVVFSLLVFLMPSLRALWRRREAKKVADENARLLVLKEILARAPSKEPVPDQTLRAAWRVATGEEPTSKQLTKRVVELGGDVDTGPNGEVRYRFPDLEAEAEAVEEERARASDGEARVGRVIFASDA
jgi:hypothetical protein